MLEGKTVRSHVDSESHYYEEGEANSVATAKGATSEDARDMVRMGKTQETRRNFRSITILGFCMVRTKCLLSFKVKTCLHLVGYSIHLGGRPFDVRVCTLEWRNSRIDLGLLHRHGWIRLRCGIASRDGLNVSPVVAC